MLLLATLLAYVFATVSGRETVDDLGAATKLVELLALGLVLMPRRGGAGRRQGLRRFAAGSVLAAATMLTGASLWGASLNAHSHDQGSAHHHGPGTPPHLDEQVDQPAPGMVMRPLAATPPTPEQRAAAARLVEETRAALAPYQDRRAAIAAGYRPAQTDARGVEHMEHKAYQRDDHILDPTRPEQVVYIHTRQGPLLAGAVFVMPDDGLPGPEIGGRLTRWHAHTICVTPLQPFIAGLVTPFGACPTGSFAVTTAEMMHLWTIDNPGGPFATELDDGYLKRLRQQ
jgi:hypothetical protein